MKITAIAFGLILYLLGGNIIAHPEVHSSIFTLVGTVVSLVTLAIVLLQYGFKSTPSADNA